MRERDQKLAQEALALEYGCLEDEVEQESENESWARAGSSRGLLAAAADTRNEAGGLAYALSPKAALAQLVMTGSLGDAFYAEAKTQLKQLIQVAGQVEPRYVAQSAIFARRQGYMKDTTAVLVAWLSLKDPDLCRRTFPQVIDNGRMVRNFVQVLRSGALGRQSLGTMPKRLVQQWLDGRSMEQLMNDAVGQSPSLKDILRLVHPRPVNPARESFYGWLLGRPVTPEALPAPVRAYEAFKDALTAGQTDALLPNAHFQLLTALPLTRTHWVAMARQVPWQTLRMNLNTFARHGVFTEEAPPAAGNGELTAELAARLSDAETIRRSRVFPFHLLATLRALNPKVPEPIVTALEAALEVALENVPAFPGQVYVLPDISGSMRAPVTGSRRGRSTSVSCLDAAALLTSAILRRNPTAEVIAFNDQVWPLALNPGDSLITNAGILADMCGGGTDLSLPLALLNERQAQGDLVVYVSDNQSWLDDRWGGETETLLQWENFRARNPQAKLVCLDLQPYVTRQAPSRSDILNIGGFSDVVFEVIANFARGVHDGEHWVAAIEAVQV